MLVLFFLSILLFVLCVCRAIYLIAKKQFSSRQASVYLLLLGFYASIFCLRFAVELYMHGQGMENYASLNSWELFWDSAVHSLQTFSMDEDYTLYLSCLKELSGTLVSFGAFTALMGGLSSLQNIAAPIIGGAILLDLLSNLFPRLALYFQSLRPKYVFSELNEKTVCLAESLAADPCFSPSISGTGEPKSQYRKKKCIIFTDAYVDKDNERRAELLQRAKRLGAVCLSDDVSSLKLYGFAPVTYLLMDLNETNNLNTAIALSEETTGKSEKTVRVYRRLCGPYAPVQILFFSQNDNSAELVSSVYKDVKDIDEKEARKDSDNTDKAKESNSNKQKKRPRFSVKVVREDTGLVYDLLDQYPLYLPLLAQLEHEKNEHLPHAPKKLSVLVIGSTPVSREMILASYWCGQMLDPDTKEPVPLEIHVVVPGQPDRFAQEMAQLMPGVKMGPSADQDPYAQIRFYSMDREGTSLDTLFSANPQLQDCNYVLTAVDNGPKNYNIAQWLYRRYTQFHLKAGFNPVRLFYIVEDDYLCGAMNATGKKHLVAFGRLSDRFSTRNVFTPELEDRAVHGGSKSEKFLRSEYDRRSKTSSALHARYKVFSVAPDLLDGETGRICTGRAGLTRQMLREELDLRYRDYRKSEDPEELDGRDYLAWLEHRRWNAYTFSIGYSHPSPEELDAYFYQDETSTGVKSMSMKLHGCLVDSRCTHRPISQEAWQGTEPSDGYDELDQLSIRFNQMMRTKFHQEMKVVEERREDMEKYLKEIGYSKRDGYFYGEDGSYFRGLSSDENAAMQAKLSEPPVFIPPQSTPDEGEQLKKIYIQLFLPTDFKQYDYGCIDSIPDFSIPG